MERTGQVLIVGLDRPAVPPDLARWIERRALGGVFLYGAALGAPDATRALCRELQARAAVPLFVAIDQEGGRVQAWGPPHGPAWPSPREVGAAFARTGDPAPVVALGRRIGRQLAEAGINVDFAPVLDVDTNPANPIIGDRSFGPDAERVRAVGCLFAQGLAAAGVIACGKHFPGHGDTARDSHLTCPVVPADEARLHAVELAPFRGAIAEALPMIMTAHVLYPALDPDRPATLSPAILRGLLRTRLGFEGLVVTDDLKMRGVRDEHDLEDAAVAAFEAGCDLLLSATEHDRHEALLDGLERARRDGRVSPGRWTESLDRIAAVKARRLGPPGPG
jgi:beta-N-acetylhexosaminidase